MNNSVTSATQGGYWLRSEFDPTPLDPIKWIEGGAQVERMQIDPDLRPPQVRGWGGVLGSGWRVLTLRPIPCGAMASRGLTEW